MTTLDRIKWFGTACGIAGALIIAMNLPFSGWGFVIFLGNSAAWLVAAYRQRDMALGLVNIAFTITNVIGIVRWLVM